MARTIVTTLLRLADDTTTPITIRKADRDWSVVTIDGKPVKRCKRGHVILKQTAHIDRGGYWHCKVCNRIASQRYRDANKITLSRKRRERYRRSKSANWCKHLQN